MDCGQILVREISNRISAGKKMSARGFLCRLNFNCCGLKKRTFLSLSLSLALYSKRLTRYLASGKQKLLYFPLVLLDFEIRYFRLTSDLICIIISLIIYHIGHTGWFIGSGEIWLGNWIVCKLSIENKSWHKRQTFLNDCWCNQCAWWYCKCRAYCLPKIRGFRCLHLLSIVIVSFVRLEGKKTSFFFRLLVHSFIHWSEYGS